MNLALPIALLGGLFALSRFSSKSKALERLELIFTKFAIVKRPLYKYLKDGLPVKVEAAALNDTNEPLRFNAFNGSFRLGNSPYWNKLNFVPENGIGIPPSGSGLIKFRVDIPTEAVFNAIDQISKGTIKPEVQIRGEVITNTLKIQVNQTIPLNLNARD